MFFRRRARLTLVVLAVIAVTLDCEGAAKQPAVQGAVAKRTARDAQATTDDFGDTILTAPTTMRAMLPGGAGRTLITSALVAPISAAAQSGMWESKPPSE